MDVKDDRQADPTTIVDTRQDRLHWSTSPPRDVVRICRSRGAAHGYVVVSATRNSFDARWVPLRANASGSCPGAVLRMRGICWGWIHKLNEPLALCVGGKGIVSGNDVHPFIASCVATSDALREAYSVTQDGFTVRATGAVIRNCIELAVHAMTFLDVDIVEELRIAPHRHFAAAVDSWGNFKTAVVGRMPSAS